MTEPSSRRRIVRERRNGLVIAGVMLAALAGIALLLAFVLANREHARIIDTAKVSGVVPFDAEFDAEAGRHVVLLERPPIENNERFLVVGRVRCDIRLSDGTITSVGDRSQNGATRSDIGETVGTFDAVAGTTTVWCEFQENVPTFGRYPLVISEEPSPGLIGTWTALGATLVLGALSAALVWLGLRGRMVVVPAAGD